MKFVKAHALGNDFLLLDAADVPKVPDRPALTRALCERRRGIGADGAIFYSARTDGAVMQLLNADGSRSEVSGNGVRCLAAALAGRAHAPVGSSLTIHTDAGPKVLRLAGIDKIGIVTSDCGESVQESILIAIIAELRKRKRSTRICWQLR